ncbi:MAG: ABC transporter substrate-binding protein [Betaproteobacteria bacterium]|nr:ABC transporter substrate-binding protein [Betaproteobacteria bacterium]
MRVALAALLLALAAATAQAKTLRWSSQGDAATHDPHAQNEGVNNQINGQIYEQLLVRDKNLKSIPCLAVSWKQTSPTVWVFNLRKGVKWQDGSPFTADDVVFSILRAQQDTSNMKVYAVPLGKPRKIDDFTVEFTTPVPNPVMIDMVSSGNIFIMSKAWATKHKVEKPLNHRNGEETYASKHAMGTGPYMLVSREPDVKTVLKKNPNWWGIAEGRFEGNVDEVVYRPIKQASTRVAALLSGEIDFVLDPPVQDIQKLKQEKSLKVLEGRENRVIFIGMDQARDQLLYSNVKGKNPFKDRRVRLALYQAVDVNAIETTVMRGLSIPTAIQLSSPKAAGIPDAMDQRYPLDLAASRKLLAEAGYPSGFSVTIDCPNDRYVNDEKICIALAGMWARIGVDVKVNAISKTTYFPKLQKLDTSMYLLGWGGATTDAIFSLKPVMHSRNNTGAGEYNWGDYRDATLDGYIDRAEGETDQEKRRELIVAAMKRHHDEVLHIPLHVQVSPWVSKANVSVVHRADNWLEVAWVKM